MESDSSKRTEEDSSGTGSREKPPSKWPCIPDIKGITNYRFDFPPEVRAKPDPSYVEPPSEFVFPFTIWVSEVKDWKIKYNKPFVDIWFGTDDPRNKYVRFNLQNPSPNRLIAYAVFHTLSKLPETLQLENGRPIRICVPNEMAIKYIQTVGKKNDIRMKLVKEAARLWNCHGCEVHFVVTEKRYDGRGLKFQEFIDGTFKLDDKKGQEDYRAEGVTVTRTYGRHRISSLKELKSQ